MQLHTGKYVLFGDLNEVRFEYERLGSSFSHSESDLFNSFINNSGLIELPMGRRLFTWMNKAGTKLSKLDRFLFSENIIEEISDLCVTALDRLWSDQNPILLHCNKIDKLDKIETFDLFQKSHINWDIEGDENSNFFHGLVNQRNRSNLIQGIMHEGVWVTDPLQVKGSFLNFFKEKFQPHVPTIDFLVILTSSGLNPFDRDSLKKNVSLDEIKNAVWDCGSDKSPGPDGFTFGFVKRYWDLLKLDIQEFVSKFLESKKMSTGSNSSLSLLFQSLAIQFI
nr:RNA-directed DNA polymerase, eukaryota, reverse transcriptase zinc-binding domain protein [Tanacetum cinerariifolium]